MKKAIIILFAAAGLIACKNGDKQADVSQVIKDSLAKDGAQDHEVSKPVDTANYTSIQWLDSTFLDLGKQKEEKKLKLNSGLKKGVAKNW